MKEILTNFLKNNNYDLSSSEPKGISINLVNNELEIKGSKLDLIELADYILNVAVSINEKDHLHLDEMTLINSCSVIKNVVIEKE